MKHFLVYIALLSVVLPCGCISGHTERVADVNPSGWLPADTVWVAYENSDTVSVRNLSVIVRSDTGGGNDMLHITICTLTPDSLLFYEAVTLNTAAAGIINNDHLESVIPYRLSNVLSKKGTYRFGFVPGNRYTGVTAIGIKLE